MTSIAKTIVATGASSGLGFETVKQMLGHAQAYKFILGARDTKTTQAAYDELKYDKKHHLTILPLELSDLNSVKAFGNNALSALAEEKLDYLFMNAGAASGNTSPGLRGSKWCGAYIVNHLSQHYLTHLLREKLIASQSRLIIVSSGIIRQISDPSKLDVDLMANSNTGWAQLYGSTKFTQLLGANWWRRQLADSCKVITVSPGLIPGTGLSRDLDFKMDMSMPDAKTVPEGGASILRAFTIDDFPEDPERNFLTSWGEWWGKDVYALSLDKELQNKWCLSKEEIEKEENITA